MLGILEVKKIMKKVIIGLSMFVFVVVAFMLLIFLFNLDSLIELSGKAIYGTSDGYGDDGYGDDEKDEEDEEVEESDGDSDAESDGESISLSTYSDQNLIEDLKSGPVEWIKTYTGVDWAMKRNGGYTLKLKENERVEFRINGEVHYVGVVGIGASKIVIEIASAPKKVEIKLKEEKEFEITGDDYNDVSVKLISIEGDGAVMIIKIIPEEMSNFERILGEKTFKFMWRITLLIGLWILVPLFIVIYWIKMKKKTAVSKKLLKESLDKNANVKSGNKKVIKSIGS